ncbi:pilin [Streptodolium elevatio]
MLLVFASAAPAFPANDIPTVINNTRNWIVGILAGLATLFLTIGGLRYVMAGGDPGEVEKAKAALRAAAIGYALAILAPVLLEILQGIVGTDPAQTPAPPPQEARDA